MPNDNEWTQARFNSFIKSALRSATKRWPPKYKTLNEACVGVEINKSTNRKAKHYKCAGCEGHFPLKEVQVDHIVPIIDPKTGFVSWDETINKMFCEKEGLQVLCSACHKEKTIAERATRKEYKNGK